MSNLLSIPFKKTYPVDIKDAARAYIYAHGGGHPDEFKDDINSWQNLRKDSVGGVVHVDRVSSFLLYHAQLVSILTKFPADMNLDFAYAPVFQPKAIPITLKSIAFERAAVLFNLASLYSQLAASEDRSSVDGIKRATTNYQYAAGVLSYMRASITPKLVYPPNDEDIPRDLSDPFVAALEFLMLSQAQECSWQMAKLNQYKNGLIAKLAARVATLYDMTTKTIYDAVPPIKDLFPMDWLPHVEAKRHHFLAVSNYRKSMEEIENNRYGIEIAWLHEARSEVKKAHDIARRGRIAPLVIQDIHSLLEVVEKSIGRAERDNDLIYHHDVPASSNLAPIAQTNLVSATIPRGLSDPASLVENDRMLFRGLMSWSVKEAIHIYHDRKKNLVGEKIVNVSGDLQDVADETLQQLNLPSALEALERPIGMPPSLLKKAEEVRLEDGPAKIGLSIEDVQRLAQQDQAILDEAMDILDNEASEDEAARKHGPLNRLPSHEANVELIDQEKRYRRILNQASESDEVVRRKWDEWEQNIVELTWSQEDLEAFIPSSALTSSTASTPQAKEVQLHARALRVQIEALDDVHRAREQLVRRVQALAAADDPRERMMKVAVGFARFAEVEPAMFEDVSDEELAKYDKFLKEISEIDQQQGTILAEIQRRNELFLQTRKDDPAVKEREHALQSLDLAYHKYREITRNLEEGLKFYNDLATILLQFKEACKAWSRLRNQQIHSLTRAYQSMSLGSQTPPETVAQVPPTPASVGSTSLPVSRPAEQPRDMAQTLTRTPPQISDSEGIISANVSRPRTGLPALNSSDWGFENFQLPPPPSPNEVRR